MLSLSLSLAVTGRTDHFSGLSQTDADQQLLSTGLQTTLLCPSLLTSDKLSNMFSSFDPPPPVRPLTLLSLSVAQCDRAVSLVHSLTHNSILRAVRAPDQRAPTGGHSQGPAWLGHRKLASEPSLPARPRQTEPGSEAGHRKFAGSQSHSQTDNL